MSKVNFVCRERAYVRKARKHLTDEDVDIASMIAEHYGLSMCLKDPPPRQGRNLSSKEIVNDYFNVKLGFHENMFSTGDLHKEPVYHSGGVCGELLRGYWLEHPSENFIRKNIRSANVFRTVGMSDSVNKILRTSFNDINKLCRLGVKDVPLTGMHLYKETRNRVHFGRSLVAKYISNVIGLEPLGVSKIRLVTEKNSDPQLLFALIFVRYQKELLNFKIQGKRAFDKKTIELAERINEQFPLTIPLKAWSGDSTESVASSDDKKSIDLSKDGVVAMTAARKYMLDASRTRRFRDVFTSQFSEEIYWKAQQFATENWDGVAPLYRLTPLIATVKVLTDIDVAQRAAARRNTAEKAKQDLEFLFG